MLRHDNGSVHTGGTLLQFPIGRDAGVASPAVADEELVLVRGIRFSSLCEQHLLPYYGAVHVGYIHGENDLSSTEFLRIVEACSRGIQEQQRMTTRMGLWLHHQLAPRGVGVLVEGGYSCATEHGCAPLAGPTTTLAFYGSFRHSADQQREFLTLARQEMRKGQAGNE
ncbi:hypothetical protein BST27_27770 [Mycobacterium intermedium]|uniref:GTP cyclohydrolase 1 n=1 Tax=Mycobacterium intermedium TaxID=28445 RepID=A0A1E3SC73_MYCIE|nr:GTP cyclohydrolase I [Mycobacterium intermedium]MCV6962487.1 GTP cyclohydrolase I [Mycobacterium intermedium]ODQ99760.1 hypothetical protein BHQ20_15795 [Mycobacterium intermedium]OPE46754.1 hypothetical protein BV508_24780 [Mycobacterium intermedium]ORA94589.1 hypothetical protein BST27_27770 [Mycobacterium intermedium]